MPYVTQVSMPIELHDRIREYQGNRKFASVCREALTQWVEKQEWDKASTTADISDEAKTWMGKQQ